MSIEFGSYTSGYFHDQISTAADDCVNGNDELTRLWGEFLKEFTPVAYAIARSEASDSSKAFSINENLKQMKILKEKMSAIESYLDPFRSVADEAIRNHVRGEILRKNKQAKLISQCPTSDGTKTEYAITNEVGIEKVVVFSWTELGGNYIDSVVSNAREVARFSGTEYANPDVALSRLGYEIVEDN